MAMNVKKENLETSIDKFSLEVNVKSLKEILIPKSTKEKFDFEISTSSGKLRIKKKLIA